MSEWQPIETAPKDVAIDIWIKSQENPTYGRRAVDVAIVGGKWYGENLPEDRFGEYASHWMPRPSPPKEPPNYVMPQFKDVQDMVNALSIRKGEKE